MFSKAAYANLATGRVTAQLVEAESGKHVWAERYDRDLVDVFAVQDEIAEAVTIAIAPAIADADQHRAMRKPPGSLDAWAACQRGLWHLSKANIEDHALAQKFFKQAVDLDPSFAGGYKGLAAAQSIAADFHGGISLKHLAQLRHSRARRWRSMVPMRRPVRGLPTHCVDAATMKAVWPRRSEL
jgi:adenylate cyclase